MTERVIIRRILNKIEPAAKWIQLNPVLGQGEFGIVEETREFKIGDGQTPWNSLSPGGLQGPPGPAGFISEDENNRLRYGTDGGLYVPELNIDLINIYRTTIESE